MKPKLASVITTLVVLALASAHQAAAQPQSINITNPASDVIFDEADEYATLVWNDPWDMSQPLDVQQLDSAKGVYPNHFNDYPCETGVWCAVAADGNPDLFLLTPGIPGALHVGRDGNLRPVDANVYKRLTFRMYLDQVPNGSLGWQVMWTQGTTSDFCDTLCGQTVFFQLYPGWNIYSVDLTAAKLSGMDWSGNLTGLRLDIGNANMTGRTVKLDWARLSLPNGDNQTINWTAAGESGNVDLNLVSSDNSITPYRAYTVLGQPETVSVNSGSYTFHGSLPPDDWRVNLTVPANGHTATSSGRWQIQSAPSLSYVKPSYTSGDDYATVVKGDPWDMADVADVGGGVVHAHTVVFSNGILSAQSSTSPGNITCVPGNCNPNWSDPQVLMQTNPLPAQYNIDTSRFRYATFSLKVDGAPDISYGYIARLYWPYDASGGNCGYTNDIPLHADWNVVSIDLWGNILDDQSPPNCNSGWQATTTRTQFRLDPHEIPIATTFYIDSILLTAMDTGSTSGDFPIEYTLGRPSDSVTFYYNTTRSIIGRQPANGGPGASVQSSFNIFLPFVTKQLAGGGPPGTLTYFWHLAGVSPNTYYISADVSDGRKTVTWFSDTPVVVTP